MTLPTTQDHDLHPLDQFWRRDREGPHAKNRRTIAARLLSLTPASC